MLYIVDDNGYFFLQICTYNCYCCCCHCCCIENEIPRILFVFILQESDMEDVTTDGENQQSEPRRSGSRHGIGR